MRRQLAIAVLMVGLVLPSEIGAQARTAGHSFGGSPGRMATGGFSSFRAASGPVRTGMTRPAYGSSWRSGYGAAPYRGYANGFTGRTRPRNPAYNRSLYYRGPYYSPYGLGYPLPWYIPYYWDTSEDSQPSEQPPPYEAEQDQGGGDEMAGQAEYPPSPVTPWVTTQNKPLPTILVYHDGHQSEVENFAILGQTLWVFTDQTTRKIPLADLDLQATKRLNDERGVNFISPDMP